MRVSGIVVDTDPHSFRKVASALSRIGGIVAMEPVEPHKIAIVVEAVSGGRELEITHQINELPGVRGVYLAYHNFEIGLISCGGKDEPSEAAGKVSMTWG